MSALDDILAHYPEDEVSAALPVIYLAGAGAALEDIPPKLQQKINQAMKVMGVDKATSPEEVAVAIAAYCVRRQVNAALLQEIANTYQQNRTADILRTAAEEVEAVKLTGGTELAKAAPTEKAAGTPKVKAKRGLKK